MERHAIDAEAKGGPKHGAPRSNGCQLDCSMLHGNCSRLRGSDRLSTGIAYLATALGTAKKPADLINSEQLRSMTFRPSVYSIQIPRQ